MTKSYVDERNRERCAQKILAYYKRASPNTINDGDQHHAHYTCYKYRGKVNKLYKKLEKKYGVVMKEVDEWEDEVEDDIADDETEENLDEKGEEL
jgi:RNase H-fold protein (predicted Holliday junction resolvase)